jgi:hypothetical protein
MAPRESLAIERAASACANGSVGLTLRADSDASMVAPV